jgi:hypothetical protein
MVVPILAGLTRAVLRPVVPRVVVRSVGQRLELAMPVSVVVPRFPD